MALDPSMPAAEAKDRLAGPCKAPVKVCVAETSHRLHRSFLFRDPYGHIAAYWPNFWPIEIGASPVEVLLFTP